MLLQHSFRRRGTWESTIDINLSRIACIANSQLLPLADFFLFFWNYFVFVTTLVWKAIIKNTVRWFIVKKHCWLTDKIRLIRQTNRLYTHCPPPPHLPSFKCGLQVQLWKNVCRNAAVGVASLSEKKKEEGNLGYDSIYSCRPSTAWINMYPTTLCTVRSTWQAGPTGLAAVRDAAKYAGSRTRAMVGTGILRWLWPGLNSYNPTANTHYGWR